MLSVTEDVVREALAMPPTYGVWEIPPRAQALDPHERDVVMGVVDALLRAKRGAAKKMNAAGGAAK